MSASASSAPPKHVGLPLVLVLADGGFTVGIVDTSAEAVKTITVTGPLNLSSELTAAFLWAQFEEPERITRL
jgi:hypothetical protein